MNGGMIMKKSYGKWMAVILSAALACQISVEVYADEVTQVSQAELEKEMADPMYHSPERNVDVMDVEDNGKDVNVPEEEEAFGPFTVYVKVLEVKENGFWATTDAPECPNIIGMGKFFISADSPSVQEVMQAGLAEGAILEVTTNGMVREDVLTGVQDINLWDGTTFYDADALYAFWQQNGYPDNVCGYYYLSENKRLIALLEDTPEAEAAILAQVKNREKIVFCKGTYSYNELKRIHEEISAMMQQGALDGVITCGVMLNPCGSTPAYDGNGPVPEPGVSYSMENYVEVTVLEGSDKAKEYEALFAEKYGSKVWVMLVSTEVCYDDVSNVPAVDTKDIAYDDEIQPEGALTVGINDTAADAAPAAGKKQSGSAAKKAGSINKKRAVLKVGQSCKLKIKNTIRKITWRSSKESVVKINKNGKMKALKAGKAVITAKAGGQKYQCKVTVKA